MRMGMGVSPGSSGHSSRPAPLLHGSHVRHVTQGHEGSRKPGQHLVLRVAEEGRDVDGVAVVASDLPGRVVGDEYPLQAVARTLDLLKVLEELLLERLV